MAKKLPKEKSQGLKKKRFFCFLKEFYLEGVLFFITLLLGIFTTYRVSAIIKNSEDIIFPRVSFLSFFIFFIFLTIFILFFTVSKKFRRAKGTIYKTLFVLAILGGGSYILDIWMGSIGFLLMVLLVIIWFKFSQVFIHNLVVILGMAGAGSLLGMGFTPQAVIVLLLFFSLYDFIAVYKTKHMIKMAKSMIEEGAILGLIIPLNPSDFFEDLKEVKPGGKFYILGGGDVVFPLILAVAVLPQGVLSSLVVSLFALAGLFFTFWFFCSQKNRNPIPALPPIALASVLGYLVTLVF